MAKSDYGHTETDKILAVLEKKIIAVYQEASEDMGKTVRAYFKQFAKRDLEEQKRLESGEITKDMYTQWRLDQMGRGERYTQLRDKLAERYTNANQTAVSYVNDATPGIYSLNRNYAEYTIEQVGGNVGFTLWDESTVKRLIQEQPNLMPYYPAEKAIRRGIDLAYGQQQITASVTSGILQGESVYRIADDLMHRITTMSRESAIRTARTAVTEAENAGRQDAYDQAEQMGIEMEKEWMATLDDRTRETHQEADGQVVDYNEPFIVGNARLMYPGDESGPPEEIYNCRCTMVARVKGIDQADRERWAKDDEGNRVNIGNMTYKQWEEWKEKNGD